MVRVERSEGCAQLTHCTARLTRPVSGKSVLRRTLRISVEVAATWREVRAFSGEAGFRCVFLGSETGSRARRSVSAGEEVAATSREVRAFRKGGSHLEEVRGFSGEVDFRCVFLGSETGSRAKRSVSRRTGEGAPNGVFVRRDALRPRVLGAGPESERVVGPAAVTDRPYPATA